MRTRSRILNRMLLFFAGVLALAGALLAALPLLPQRFASPWPERLTRTIDDVANAVQRWRIPLPGMSVDAGAAALGVLGILLAAMLLFFLGTRRRRRARTVLRFTDGAGSTAVDETIADEVLSDPLRDRADVLSSRTRAYRVGGRTALRVAVVPRAGADLAGLISEAQRRASDWDALSGTRAPVVVHLADRGGLDRLRSAARVR